MSKSRFTARGTGLRLGLAACLITTGIAVTTAAQAAGETTAAGETGGSEASAPQRASVSAHLAGRGRRHVLGVRPIGVRGRLAPGTAGRRVRLQVGTRGGWKVVDRTLTGRGGAYSTTFRPSGAGNYRLRVSFAGDDSVAGDATKLPPVHVYTAGGASWYGPGFYGNRTACGQTLTGGIRGVANRSLPCGTKVRLFYRGRSTTARVIDRGPYSGGRSWDLTPATKRALRFGDTGTVWAAY